MVSTIMLSVNSLSLDISKYFASLKLSSLLNRLPLGLAQGLIWGILALGVFMTFRMLGVSDLTVDGSMTTGAAVCMLLCTKGMDPRLALQFSFLVGIIAGLVTGFLHTKLGIPDILAGILTQISLYSVNLRLMGSANLSIIDRKITAKYVFSSNDKVMNQTILALLLLCAVTVVVLYMYLGTEHGSALRATGINSAMARAQGINTNKMKVTGLAISNGLVALSGGITAQYQSFADVKMGTGAIVTGLAAVIIGDVLYEAIMGKRKHFLVRLCFIVFGSVLYYMIYHFILWLKLPADDMKLLTAVIVAIFLAVPNLRNAKQNSFSRIAKQNAAKKEG